MEYQIIEQENIRFLECGQDQNLISGEPEALDLVGACGGELVDTVLIYSDNLPPEFFELKSGLAGRIMLKFSNYRIRVAAVIPNDQISQGHFEEMVSETNRGNQFRVFPTREAAMDWIVKINHSNAR